MSAPRSTGTTTAPSAATPTTATGERPSWKKVLWSAMLGNAVEWYDNALYGILAVTIAATFFPQEDAVAAMIATYLGLILSYAVRPIGGALIGRFGDIKGRRWVLTFTILLMSVGTLGIGLIPGYAAIGIGAPLLLAACRLIQGFGASAEYTTAANFLLEHAPKGRRNYLSGWSVGSTSIGPLLAATAAFVLLKVMPEDDFASWGWRLLFLAAAPLSLVTIYIRRRTEESPEFLAVLRDAEREQVKQRPFTDAVRGYWRDMLKAIGLGAGQRIGSFMIQSYFVAALIQNGFAAGDALLAAILTYIVGAPAAIWGGYMADRFGGRKLLIIGYAIFAVITVPTFIGIGSHSLVFAFIAVVVFTVMNNIVGGPLTTAYVMSFPPNVRNAAAGFNYNIGTTVIGGTAPLIAAWLFGVTGSEVSFGVYMAIACVVSILVAVFAFPRSIDEELHEARSLRV